MATEDFIKRWPYAVNFNLSWEEIYYKLLKKIKVPKDNFSRNEVIHHAWGTFFKNYLIKSGVKKENIFVNGNPVYQLYKLPYSKYFHSRQWLSVKYKLNIHSKWIFIPENYRWAFVPDNKINSLINEGIQKKELLKLITFSKKSLKILLKWCNRAASEKSIEIIFRARPATKEELIKDFFSQNISNKSRNLHFIKNESVRDWILATNAVISSVSTSLIEASVANKPTFMALPKPLPDNLKNSWYKKISVIKTYAEFSKACLGSLKNINSLKIWAEKEMLSRGDPIIGLADFINNLVQHSKLKSGIFYEIGNLINKQFTATYINFKSKDKTYLNTQTHENDLFTQHEISEKVKAWRKVLKLSINLN